MHPRRFRDQVFRLFTRLTLFALLAFVALLAALRIEHSSPITLPAPTGPFAVGRVLYDWADPVNLDPVAPVPGTKRELLVWLWYPADPTPSPAFSDYIPANEAAEVERDLGPILGGLFTRDLAKVHGHSIRNAAVSTQQPSYPVLVMRGGASAEVWNYSTLAEDLASHGYVVAAFDAPYRSHVVAFPDGRVMRRAPENNPELCEEQPPAQQSQCVSKILNAWISDIAFTLDRLAQLNASDPSGQFQGRLDLARIGVFGHSFGGATAAQFCHDDPRCKAAIDIDGQPFGSVIQSGLRQPFLFLMGDHSGESDPASAQIMANLQSLYDHLPAATRQRLFIRGANHFLFSDDSALLKSHIVMRTLRAFGIVRITGPRQLAITAYALHTFFDAHLKSPTATATASPATSAPPATLPSPQYPELQPQN